MSPIQPIDAQVNIQQTAEVSRIQQNELTNPLVQREDTADMSKAEAEQADKRVQEKPESQEDGEVTDRDARGGPHEEHHRQKQKKTDEASQHAIDPDKGNILDITT